MSNNKDHKAIHDLFSEFHSADNLGLIKSKIAKYVTTVRAEARKEAFKEAGLIVRQLSLRSEKYPARYTTAAGFKTRVECALERAAADTEKGVNDG